MGELDQWYPAVQLTEAEAAGLNATKLVQVQPRGGGFWQLSPLGMVGAAEVGEVLLEVRPKDKVGISQLLFLLGYARDPGFQAEDVAAQRTTDLWSSLAESLARLCERALARGVLHGYVSVEESLRTVRGRIRITDQMSRRPGMLLPLEVTYDEHTADIAENRIIRGAVRMLLRLNRVDPLVRKRLAHLDRKLDGVAVHRAGTPVPIWRETRANSRYVPALRLARIILQNCVAETADGKIRVAAFAVNLAKVYEDFVETALGEALAELGISGGRTRRQYPAVLDHADGYTNRINMNMDVVFETHGIARVVFDAKYKASTTGVYANADHYQMLAYCTALGVPRAWLIYAGRGEQRSRRILNTGITVEEFPLDLSQHPRDVLARVALLARLAVAPGVTEAPGADEFSGRAANR